MTIHVNIGEAKTRLSQLIAAALRGEEVIVDKDGKPQVRLEPVATLSQRDRQRIAEKRRAALGMWREEFEGFSTEIPPSMTDEEVEERFRRKFGPEA